jgi:L-ascorbate metabolism protein UlaG (beta-lactamase superfamily)
MPDLKVTWFGHSTIKLETSSGLHILVDPFITGNPACPPELRNERAFDLILVTHGHGDHFGDTVNILKDGNAVVMCVFEMANYIMSRGIPHERVVGFNVGGTAKFNEISVSMTTAIHSSSMYDGHTTIDVGPPVGFVIHLEDERTIYVAGDTDVFSEMSFIGELYKPFLALLPIDGFYNMSPKAAALAVRMLGCTDVIPIHHSTFPALWGKPNALKDELSILGIKNVKIHNINPGMVVSL